MISKVSSLEEGFEHCSQGFSGSLEIRSGQGEAWCFHFFMGRIVGESGGIHPKRRWRRLLLQVSTELEKDFASGDAHLSSFQTNAASCLERLVKKSQITREQALYAAKSSLEDSLFDVLQIENYLGQTSQLRLFYQLLPESDQKKTRTPWIFFRPKNTLEEVRQAWYSWQQKGLATCSPNTAPIVYGTVPTFQPLPKDLLDLMNGERTIRDLSAHLHQDSLTVMQLLLPHIRSGVVQLKAVGDIAAEEQVASVSVDLVQPKPIVAHVEDNPIEARQMEGILRSLNCQYVHVADPLKAVPTLLKLKPNFIFLDLVMPIVNGYEVCAQLRRIDTFSQIPIVILTASEGIIDRMRAKMVGSTDFLTKPVDKEKIKATLTKYQALGQEPVLSTY